MVTSPGHDVNLRADLTTFPRKSWGISGVDNEQHKLAGQTTNPTIAQCITTLSPG